MKPFRNFLVESSEGSEIGDEIVKILEILYRKEELNEYFIDNDRDKWIRLVNDILINKFDYPWSKWTMEEAEEIYKNSVVRWKESHKMMDLMSRR